MEPILPAVEAALAASTALVLQAPPGAGKTTLVPLALRDANWLNGQTIVMLEPRRLAARGAAYRIAHLLDEPVGQTVGYRMRGDTKISRRTRIEVVTEGVLTRRLQRDPTLEGVGLVIFDEFHERSVDADLGLALTRRTQALVRDDLRILIMSATLDGSAVARLLGGAPVLTSEGRNFPVETRYRPPRADVRIEAATVGVVLEALRDEHGDLLVFLPGAGEIRRVEAALAERDLGGAAVTPLYGMLSQAEQDRAVRPDPGGGRKIVLSTAIAETSLTIEGIRIVIDSGLSRVPRFAPRTGMTRLDTVRVSRASAEQRRGRAGRLESGVCYRLWAEHENHALLASTPPEITSADVAPLALELAAAGVSDPAELDWLDPPAPAAFAQGRELLTELDAVDATGHLTPHGREMAEVPVHPRLAHMLLEAALHGSLRTAAVVAALLGERDIFRGSEGQVDADLAARIAALDAGERALAPPGAVLDREAVRRVRLEADRLVAQLRRSDGATQPGPSHLSPGMLAALAYPDRVAQRRAGERARYVLRNGRGAELVGAQSLSQSPYIVAIELDDRRPESRVFRAAAVDEAEIRQAFGAQIALEDVVGFDDASASVITRRREMLGAITLRDVDLPNPQQAAVTAAFLEGVRKRGIAALPWSEGARHLRQRLAFAAHHDGAWPDVSDATLSERLEEWLGPAVQGMRRVSDLARIDLGDALLGLLDWRRRGALEDVAPSHLVVPTGSRIGVDYSDPDAPVLAVRIQEVFGMTESPRLLEGRVPVTLHLLSPAHRPVQVTRDLAGFWRTSYFDVRKDLRGRYPKHEWPEDPLSATPTRRAKPRRDS
ncbi:MAG TPA: ATP-dependent helicase HrpB [Gemmatimonadaceae bacterium]|nr:ATP-dependent helicase HrpB [Gemmatimonadaceae bacterium]